MDPTGGSGGPVVVEQSQLGKFDGIVGGGPELQGSGGETRQP
ncbi:hypothetical protein OH799_30785 [Nocardia sp. NBC_00881]|nr:hypothetical protein OH799_30785 [Nocardia sp. NBC_00881]